MNYFVHTELFEVNYLIVDVFTYVHDWHLSVREVYTLVYIKHKTHRNSKVIKNKTIDRKVWFGYS